MNAKRDDLSRLQEIHDIFAVPSVSCARSSSLVLDFGDPDNDEDDLIAEGIMNRVLRVTEEVGRLSRRGIAALWVRKSCSAGCEESSRTCLRGMSIAR